MRLRISCIGLAVLSVGWACGAATAEEKAPPIVGRWDITFGGHAPSWLGVEMKDGKLQGSFVGTAGSVGGVDDLRFDGDKVGFRRGDEVWAGKLDGDTITGEIHHKDGKKTPWTAKRFVYEPDVRGTWEIKAGDKSDVAYVINLKGRGDTVNGSIGRGLHGRESGLSKVTLHGIHMMAETSFGALHVEFKGDQLDGTLGTEKIKGARNREWGEPIQLFDGKSLTGWTGVGGAAITNWKAKDGELVNERSGANIRTERTFTDFKLHVEFNLPEGGNSGVYLRGRYEVQIAADYGQKPGGGGCAALYSRIVPSENASRKPGEWQTYDITIIGQYLTVVHNGKTVIDNQDVVGITGGAIDSHEYEPGPIYLQGDHSSIRYRNIVLTPTKVAENAAKRAKKK